MPEETRTSPEVVCVGNIVVDIVPPPMRRLPEAGELTVNDELRINMGGCGATTAAALTRLGVRTTLVTTVGGDILGDFALAELKRLGVDTSRVTVCPDRSTSTNIILLVEGEDRRYVYTMGATSELRASLVDVDMIRASRFLFVGAYLLPPNLVQEELLGLFRTARSAGARTVLDVATVRSPDQRKSLDKLLAETDYFLPNDDEARIITGRSSPRDQARAFRDMGVGTAVVTCGPEGAAMANNDGLFAVGVHPGTYVDGTGAGDCFDAAFLCALLAGKSDLDALVWGSAAGAACVRNIGGTTNLMTRDQLREFVEDNPLDVGTLNA